MRYWDSSAVIPLLVDEPQTGRMMALYRSDREMLVWWATEVECASALNRLRRALAARDAGRCEGLSAGLHGRACAA